MGMYVAPPQAPDKRVFYQVHTRKLDRSVAHHNMEIAELKHVNKHDYARYQTMTGMTMQEYLPSYFARHWRDTVSVPTTIYSRRNKK